MSNIFDQLTARDSNTEELPGGDEPKTEEQTGVSTSSEVKEATQELLRYGYIEAQLKPAYFRRAMSRQREIDAALEPLDLALRLDEHRGVAFLVIAESAFDTSSDIPDWSHPLVRRQRLTLEQSLLVAMLRQAFVLHEQEAGVGEAQAKVAVEDLVPEFRTYCGDSGSDAKDESRLSNLLDQLKTFGVVSEVDKNGEVTIRPLIAHLANPHSLTALLKVLKERAEGSEHDAKAAR